MGVKAQEKTELSYSDYGRYAKILANRCFSCAILIMYLY